MSSSTWLTALVVAAAGFGLSKVVFGLLGWYTQLGADALYRKGLDQLWDDLHALKFPDLAHGSLKRLVGRLCVMLEQRQRAILIFFAVVLLMNIVSIILGLIVYSQMQSIPVMEAIPIEEHKLLTVAAFFAIPLLGCVFDGISAWITISLLKHASKSPKLSVLFLHVGIDIILAGFSLLWLVLCTALAGLLLEPGWDIIGKFLYQSEIFYDGVHDLYNGLNTSNSANLIVYLILGASTALPSLSYFAIWIAVVTVWLIPEALKPHFRNVIYLVTTDKKPVLGQLGTFFGGCTGFFGAIVTIIKA